jgi:hypothetical protein
MRITMSLLFNCVKSLNVKKWCFYSSVVPEVVQALNHLEVVVFPLEHNEISLWVMIS